MDDERVAVDEARRVAQREQVKARIRREVGSEITAHADHPRAGDSADRKTARSAQVIDYLFGVVYVMLGIRLVLAAIAARSGAGFSQWITALTDPLYAPFQGILPNLTSEGGYTFVLPIGFAILMYLVLHLGIRGLLRLIATRKTAI